MNKVIKIIDALLPDEQKLKIWWKTFTDLELFYEWATQSITTAILGLIIVFLAFAIPMTIVALIIRLVRGH